MERLIFSSALPGIWEPFKSALLISVQSSGIGVWAGSWPEHSLLEWGDRGLGLRLLFLLCLILL